MKKHFLIISLLLISSCIVRHEKRGYMFDLSDYQTLEEGITSKEKTLKIMGTPTIISDIGDDETWIYYSENLDRILFFYPTIVDRKILVLRFNENGVIKNLKSLSLADENEEIAFNDKRTAIEDHDVGFIKSIFSNVGQVKPQ